MRVRGVQLRALLLPLGVAALSAAALAWYGFVWVPAQQRYLNERNFRLLRTLSAEIKAKVDNFDLALDHALDSYDPAEFTPKNLKEYVALFAPELEVLPEKETSAREFVLKDAGDPPRVVLQRDEGRSYLYLGSRRDEQGQPVNVAAKADIESALGSFLSPGQEFDALLLVDREGQTIVQRSPTGLELASVDRLTDASAKANAGGTGNDGSTSVSTFKSLWRSSDSATVEIGDAAYRLYVQPIPLSLTRADSKRAVASPDAKSSIPDESEEWALCGLVRADKFRAASSAISYTYLLWFSAGLAGVFFTIPLLKLQVLRPRERLRRNDGVFVAATTFLVTGLLTFVLLDLYYFWHVFGQTTDQQLEQAAQDLSTSFQGEVKAIDALMKGLDRRLKTPAFRPTKPWPPEGPKIQIVKSSPRCGKERWVCQALLTKSLVQERQAESDASGFYQYFDLVAWDDQKGQQQVKWTAARKLTPFVNLEREKLPYWDDVKRAQQPLTMAPQDGIGVLVSPNSGTVVTAFWRVRPEDDYQLRSQTLILYHLPVALDHPILPPHVQFAVVDRTGKVVFHSDPGRSLNENFLQESEDNPALRALISSQQSHALSSYYLGRRHRMYAMPLKLAPSFADPEWSLVVFQQAIVPETLNLETLTLAVATFAVFAVGLAGLWAIVYAIFPLHAPKWFWPDQGKGARYRAVALANGLLGALFVAALPFLASTSLLLVTGILVVVSLVVTFVVVVRRVWPYSSTGPWQRDFLWARLSFLFVVAAVPAIACFHVAYDFEMGLFVRSGQLYLGQSLDARNDLIERRLEPLELGQETFNAFRARDYVADAQKQLELFFGTSVGPRRDAREESAEPDDLTTSRLDRFLQIVHRQYNDKAIDPESVFQTATAAGSPQPEWRWQRSSPSRFLLTLVPRNERHEMSASRLGAVAPAGHQTLISTAAVARPSGWYLLVVAAIVSALYLLLRHAVEPLYVLGPYARTPRAANPDSGEKATNRLLVGLPGSATTIRLRDNPRIRTFDVRTAAFVERRRQLQLVTVERRQVSGAAISVSGIFLGMDRNEWTEPREAPVETKGESDKWAETFDYSNLPKNRDVIIGVDHLEHRFDDASFRGQTLLFLEGLLYRHERTLWIAADRDPIDQLREARGIVEATESQEPNANNGLSAELARWTKVFESFTRATVGLPAEEISRAAGDTAEPYFRALWAACSTDEKVALRQLADEGVVNPQGQAVVARLMRNGLVVRDPTFRISSESFREFIMLAASADQITLWEHEGVTMPWGTVSTTMASVAFGLVGLLMFTQQQLLDAWVGFMPTLAPVVPKVLKWLADTQGGSKKPGVAGLL